MRTTAAVLLAAMSITGALAKPTGVHRHLHRHADKRVAEPAPEPTNYDLSNVDWKNLIDWTKVDYSGKGNNNGGSPAPSVAAQSAPAPSASTSDNTDNTPEVSTDNVDISDLWNGLVGVSNKLTSFGGKSATSGTAGDFYEGNVGVPWGSNMIKVGSDDGYDYTVEFINTSGKIMTLSLWNKKGSDGRPLSGGAMAPEESALTFVLQPNDKQVVAFDSDSQIGFAQATDAKAPSGHFATSFGECNMAATGPTCNLSAILNPKGNTYKMSISNKENDCISSQEQNCWVTETKTLPGLDGKDRNGSCYIYGQVGHFTAEMGGQQ